MSELIATKEFFNIENSFAHHPDPDHHGDILHTKQTALESTSFACFPGIRSHISIKRQPGSLGNARTSFSGEFDLFNCIGSRQRTFLTLTS